MRIQGYKKLNDLPALLTEYSHNFLLVPGSSDKAAALELCPGRNSASVLTWPGLYRLLCTRSGVKPLTQIDPPDHWLALTAAEKSLARHPERPANAAGATYLRAAGEAFKDLLAENLGPEQLTPLRPYDGALFSAYLAELTRLGAVDPAALPAEAKSALESSETALLPEGLCALGFMSLTANQMELLRALDTRGCAVTVFSPDAGALSLTTLYEQMDAPCRPEFTPLEGYLLNVPDRRGRGEETARLLKAWERGKGPLTPRLWPGWEGVALWCAPEDERAVTDALNRYEVPWRYASGSSVAGGDLWRTAALARQTAAEGFEALATERLLSLPALGGFNLNESVPLPRGYRNWMTLLQTQGRQDLVRRGKNYTVPAAALHDAAALHRSLSKADTPLEGLKALRDWARRRLPHLRAACLVDPSADENLSQWNGALKMIERKAAALALGWGATADGLSSQTLWAYLCAWAEGSKVSPGLPIGEAAQLYVGTLPVLTRCKVICILGGELNRWPGKSDESPLLPDSARQAITAATGVGLPGSAELKARKLALLRRYTAAADDFALVVCAEGDEKGDPLAPSPALDDPRWWRHQEITADSFILTPIEKIAPTTERTVPGHLKPLEATTFSPSGIDLFKDCPFAWYNRQILKLPSPAPKGFDPLRGGNVLHALWESRWQALITEEELLTEQLEETFEQAIITHYPELNDPDMAAYKNRLRRPVGPLAALQQKHWQALKPLVTETILEAPLPPTSFGPLTLRGRADRLHRLRDGSLLFVDYKSGRADHYRSSLQQACYALTAETAERCSWIYLCHQDQSTVYCLTDELNALLCPEKKSSDHTRLSLLQTARTVLDQAATACRQGLFLPDYDSPHCRICSFAPLCRKGEMNAMYERERQDD